MEEIEHNKRNKKGVVFENKDIANKEISIKQSNKFDENTDEKSKIKNLLNSIIESEKKKEDDTIDSTNFYFGSTAKDFNPIAMIFMNTLQKCNGDTDKTIK